MERLRHLEPEEHLPRARRGAAATGPASGAAPAPPEQVTVTWGFLQERLDAQAMTVGELFDLLHSDLNIPQGVEARVNSNLVGPDHRLEAGDELEFIRASGEKGACA